MKNKILQITLLLFTIILILTSCKADIERITITNSDVKVDEAGEKYAVVYLDENSEATYKIEYEIYPKRASDNEVEFKYNKNTPHVTVDEDGTVKFTSVTALSVTVTSKECTDYVRDDTILIIAKYKNN